MRNCGLRSCRPVHALLCAVLLATLCGCAPKRQTHTLVPHGLTYRQAVADWGKPKDQVAFGNGPICVWNARHKTTAEPGHLIVAFSSDGSVREAWFRPGPFDEDTEAATLHESFGR